jgi:hypothetical protein
LAVSITILLIAETAGPVELRNVVRWSAVATIPSEFLAVQIDRVGIPLRHAVVTDTVANPTQWDAVPVAVECLTRTTDTTAVRLTDNVGTLLPGIENAAPDLTDSEALAIAHIAIEAAGTEPGISAVVLAGLSDTNWQQRQNKHTTKTLSEKVDHTAIPFSRHHGQDSVESTPPPEAVHRQLSILGRPRSRE